tara:strand:+ start:6729 stop:7205 length:477 start_codon:yes stop_codon:yes gene_type:complete
MKLLRTIRLDESDLGAFPLAAEPGEYAVTGSFLFSDVDAEKIEGQVKIAYASGWLGVASFGFSTFVQVVDVDPEGLELACRQLAAQLVAELGAPDVLTAMEAARGEIEDATLMAGEHDEGTLLAIEREPDTGGLRERIRVIEPQETGEAGPVWNFSDG